jgi:hypothetical protein
MVLCGILVFGGVGEVGKYTWKFFGSSSQNYAQAKAEIPTNPQ